MKRVLSVIFVITLLLAIPLTCEASSVSVDELGFSIDLPYETVVLKRDTPPDSPCWEQLQADANTFLDFFKTNSIYLDAINPDLSYEIVIIGRTSDNYSKIFDFSRYSETELQNMLPNFRKGLEIAGISIDSLTVYHSNNTNYFLFSGRDENAQADVTSYATVFNGKFIQITLRTYFGTHDNNKIKTVVDSIQYKERLSPPRSSSIDSNTVYKAVIGAISALIVGLISFLFKKVNRSSADKTEQRTHEVSTKKEAAIANETVHEKTTRKEQEHFSDSVHSPNLHVDPIPHNLPKTSDASKKNLVENRSDETAKSPANYDDQLRRLKSLLDDEIITQEEFDAKKKQILGL